MKKFAANAENARLLLEPSGVQVLVSLEHQVLQLVSPVDDSCLALTPGEAVSLERFLFGLQMDAAREAHRPFIDDEVRKRVAAELPAAVEAEIARRAQENEQ